MGELEVWTIEVEIAHSSSCQWKDDGEGAVTAATAGECPHCRAHADYEVRRDA